MPKSDEEKRAQDKVEGIKYGLQRPGCDVRKAFQEKELAEAEAQLHKLQEARKAAAAGPTTQKRGKPEVDSFLTQLQAAAGRGITLEQLLQEYAGGAGRADETAGRDAKAARTEA